MSNKTKTNVPAVTAHTLAEQIAALLAGNAPAAPAPTKVAKLDPAFDAVFSKTNGHRDTGAGRVVVGTRADGTVIKSYLMAAGTKSALAALKE